MKPIFKIAVTASGLFGVTTASATDFNVRIVNLTNGIFFTPFLVAAHPAGDSLFTAGQPASANLQAMAEGGDNTALLAEAAADIPGPAGGGEGFNPARSDAADRVAMHAGIVSQDDGFATSDLSEQHRFDNPVMRVHIERTQ